MKTKYVTLFSKNIFKFGEQTVTQFIIFESKYLFSIIFFYFHKSDGCQDRFHTHAFNAISIRIFGDYIEEFLTNGDIKFEKRRRRRIIYIPRDNFHRITKSNGCLTLLLSGSWKQTWKEYVNGEFITYNWNRII
jgi:hypothetical protein